MDLNIIISHFRVTEWTDLIDFPQHSPGFKSKLSISLYHYKWYRLHPCLKIRGKSSNSSQSKTLELNTGNSDFLMQPYVIESTMQNVKSCLQRNPSQNFSLFQWHQDFSHTSLKHLTPSAKLGQQSAAVHILGQEVLRETELGRLICCPHDTHNSDYLWPLTWKNHSRLQQKMFSNGHSFEPAVFTFSMLAAHFRHVQVQGIGTNIFLKSVSFLFVSWKLVITWVILHGSTLTHWKWALCSSCPWLRLNDTGNRTAIWLAK